MTGGFERVERNTASKMINSSLYSKLLTYTNDPMIESVLDHDTSFTANIFKQEYSLALSYICGNNSKIDSAFRVCHKEYTEKSRIVNIAFDDPTGGHFPAESRYGTALCVDISYAHIVI